MPDPQRHNLTALAVVTEFVVAHELPVHSITMPSALEPDIRVDLPLVSEIGGDGSLDQWMAALEIDKHSPEWTARQQHSRMSVFGGRDFEVTQLRVTHPAIGVRMLLVSMIYVEAVDHVGA